MNLKLSEALKKHFENPASKADLILKQIESGMYDKFIPYIQGKVVLDIGANIGLFSVWASQYAKSVLAVEPTKDHFSLLEENILLNSNGNIKPYNLALGPRRGELKFYLNRGNSTMNSIIPYGDNYTAYSVSTVPLEDLVGEAPEVNFMKMDIEGSESLLLDNADFFKALKKLDTFFIEVHSLEIIGHLPELDKIRDAWGKAINDSTNRKFSIEKEGPDGIAGYSFRL